LLLCSPYPPFGSSLPPRASKFQAIGDWQNAEFPTKDKEFFLTRVFAFKLSDIEDLHPPPVAPDPAVAAAKAQAEARAKKQAVAKAKADAVAARSMTPQERKEMAEAAKATKLAAERAQAALDADPYGGRSPLAFERGEPISWGVEHGGPAPKPPKAPPLMALFDWR
jgi:hypothetical protein